MIGILRIEMLKKISLLCVLALIVCMPGLAYAREKSARKTVLGKEKLVVKDIGGGGPTYQPRWCGNAGLIFFGEKMGIEFIEFASGKRVRLSDNLKEASALNCTPEGKWLLYVDQTVHLPEGEELSAPACTYPKYLMRFDTEIGKTEELGAIYTYSHEPYEIVSPDGKKILLNLVEENTMQSTMAEWNVVWFSEDWDSDGAVWFHDSSGVVFRRKKPDRLCAEVFGKDGWARCFNLGTDIKDNISNIVVDKNNKVYFTSNKLEGPSKDRDFLYRCGIGDKGVSCDKFLERKKHITGIAVLPDGDIIFSEAYDNCIRRVTPGQTDAKCFVGTNYQKDAYDYIGLDGVTHNGKWLVLERLRGKTFPYIHDLFVIELSTE